MYLSKKTPQNNIPADAGHFIWSEIDSTDLKKSNLATKITAKMIIDKYRKQARKKRYTVQSIVLEEAKNAEDFDNTDTIETLEDIVSLEPGKSAQLTAKKISEKYKKIREANKRKNKFKLPGEIVKIETVETSQGDVKVPVSVEKPQSSVRAAEKITKNYNKLRREKAKKLARPLLPHTFFVNKADLETIQYNAEPNEDIFANERILAAANKVFDFDKYKKEQAAVIDELKQQQIDDELFVNESVLVAANKVFDFDRYKRSKPPL